MPLMAKCQIDVPKWVDDIGGPNSSCISSGIEVDKQNNIYVSGIFSGTADMDPSAAVYNLTAKGQFDLFLAKYTTNGALIWAIDVGGSAYTQVNAMAIDQNGNCIVTGQFNSAFDADPGPGTTTLTPAGDYDAFIIKYNANGGFVWARSIGGGGTDYGSHVATDSQGNIFECVRYQSSVKVSGQTVTAGGSDFNGLTVKYDPNGNVLWKINIFDPGDSEVFDEVDSQGNVIVGGHFQGNDNFNPLGAAHFANANGNAQYIAKYTTAGQLIWVQTFAGVLVGNNINIGIDSQGNVIADGPFSSQLKFNGTTVLNPTGSQDLFLAKYLSDGTFQSAKDIGGGGSSIFNYTIHASHDDNIFITGYFSGKIDFDPSPATTGLVSDHGQRDFFLAKYDDDLNYKWAFSGGSPNCDQSLGRNTCIDNNNDVIFTGSFCSTVNFSASACTPYPLTAKSTGGSPARDSFVGKYVQGTATATDKITAFSVPQQSSPAVIDQTKLSITVTVPAGTNITALVPTIAYTTGVTLKPASGKAEDFTGGVTYQLTSACSTLNYTVNVIFSTIPVPLTVCSGTAASLTGTTESPVPDSYLWQVSQNGTWVSATGTINSKDYQTSVLNNATASNVIYSYRRQTTTAGVVAYDSYYDVTVLPAIVGNTITAPAVTTFCTTGDAAAIVGATPTGGTGTYTYQWQSSKDGTTFTNITGATAKDYDPPAITITTYYQRVLTSGTCTTPNSNIVKISIVAPPAPPAGFTQQVCTGSTATLTLPNPQAGLTYNWYDSATKTNLLFTGTSYVTGPINVNTTYYVEAVSSTCSSTTLASIQVNVIALPVAPAAVSPVIACDGSTAVLSVTNPQAGLTYNWYNVPTGGTIIATGPTISETATAPNTKYYVDAVNSNSCVSARTEVDITIIPIPTPPVVQVPAATCSGSPATLRITDPQAGLTYNWYNVPTGGTMIATGIQFAIPSLTANATYYVEAVSNTGSCTSTRTTVQVPVTPLPAAPAPFTRSVCPGSTATLTLADAQTGITYNWYDSATKNNLLFTGTTYVTGPISANTTYYVEADNGSCPAIALTSVQVNVNPVPAAPAVTTPVVACDGSTAVLKVTSPQAGLTYNWYTVATGGTSVATGSTISETAAAPNTTYYVEAVNSTGCLSVRTEVDITIIPIPSAPVVQAPATICSGSPVTLAISNPLAGITYNWYDAATGGMLLTSGTQFNTLPLINNTTYYVEAVNNTAGCTSTRTAVQVNVNQIPSAPAPFSLSVCPGGVATLTITDAKAGITYNWYDSATKANLLFTGTNYVTNAINANSTYYIEAVNGTCPAASLATVQVNVIPPPAAPAIVKNPLETCANNAVTININNPQAGLTYNWYTTSTSGTPIATGSSYLTPALTAGTTYYAEVVNAGGCASPRTAVDVIVDPQPDISAQGASVCPNTSATVTASSTSPNVTINWYANATGGTILATGNSFPAPAVSSNTNYYAEAVNTVTGCISSSRAVATVAVLQQLAAPVVSVDETTSSSITFKWDAVTGATGYLVSIDNGATYTAPSSGSNGLTHAITGLQEGQTITIIVEATGTSDCQLSGSSTAVTGTAHDGKNDIIYVANAFTPNGDGKNDIVYVHSNNIRSMIFYVYNQLGEMIFKSTDISVGWDGTYKGVKQPVGVYVYFVQAIMNDGQHLLKKGTITLLR